jgi:hypothetical protein
MAMTEAEWLGCTNLEKMLKFLPGKASDRKLCLFACACCRRIWHLMTDQRNRKGVEVTELLLEGLASQQQLHAAMSTVGQAAAEVFNAAASAAARVAQHPMRAAMAAIHVYGAVLDAARTEMTAPVNAALHCVECVEDHERASERTAQGGLLFDIFGNPFRPLPPLPHAVLAWNDGTVRRIAEGIYEERAFDRLPILADALLDAGCDNDDLIQHCRSEGPHVRGCWALDVILGKS